MFKKKGKTAFTLIELMVWISILSIIIMGASNIDYNRLSQKQRLEIFTNNIKSEFERIRNNSLAWKWVWVSLNIPETWQVDYSLSNSWTIISKAYSWTNILSAENILFQNRLHISKIRCLKLDLTENYIIPNTETGSLIIKWSHIKLWWNCTNNTSKILEITVSDRINTKKIIINSLNWLVEIK